MEEKETKKEKTDKKVGHLKDDDVDEKDKNENWHEE